MRKIKKAAVLGAGTMGSGIAALLAGVGIKTYLLDIVPPDLTEEQKKDKKMRNKIVESGLERALKARPALFYTPSDAELISCGNIEDDISWLSEVDWIIEAVFERIDVKKNTFALIDKYRKEDSIVSSNTSGISLKLMTADCSASLKKNVLVTHFFNPVRYMRLLEIVPIEETDPEVVEFMKDFGERVLGKGVVIGKDTPNFIANRIGVFGIFYLIKVMVEEGYKVEEIDKIFGPPMGRPKSAVFRTTDLVGLDVLKDVAKNLYENLTSDEMREIYKYPEFMEKMVEKGLLGSKKEAGFYKKVKVNGETQYLVYDYVSGDYRQQEKVEFESLKKAKGIEDVGARIKSIVYSDDRAGKIAWKTTIGTLSYALSRIPEIADNIYSIDNAMKWGFNWALGPFETWDAIGVKESVERMEKEGIVPPEKVVEMLKKGITSFYKKEEDRKFYLDVLSFEYKEMEKKKGVIFLQQIKDKKQILKKNPSASLLDLGDGVLLLEFHSRMNSLDDDIINMMHFALEEVNEKDKYLGLVLGNEGETFSAGANVFALLIAAQNNQWEQLEKMVASFQEANMKMKYSEKPVVVAPFNMTLGGGCEITLHAPKVRAHAELYLGLVEFGMGVIPAGGGTKETWVRFTEKVAEENVDIFPLLQKAFETIALAKVSTSAKEAFKMGFLREGIDRITLNKDRLIADAKDTVLAMAKEGYTKREKKKIKVLGKAGYAALSAGIWNFKWGNRITEHEQKMAEGLAKVLTGGDVRENTFVEEERLLELEREVFLHLLGTEKTQQRIQHFLTTGKTLRN